jgi:pyroglutamyl-peptidase
MSVAAMLRPIASRSGSLGSIKKPLGPNIERRAEPMVRPGPKFLSRVTAPRFAPPCECRGEVRLYSGGTGKRWIDANKSLQGLAHSCLLRKHNLSGRLRMTRTNGTILLTGFGPFPGAPRNPTGPLVERLMRSRNPAFAGVRRTAHVFRTSYTAVDREFPALLASRRPEIVLMFGLAQRTRRVRIETSARNAVSRIIPDAAGHRPATAAIAAGAEAILPLRTPALRLAAAARLAGVAAAPSRDAGSYLCNYLCWRACEAAQMPGGPRLIAFVHVPDICQPGTRRARRRKARRSTGRPTLDDLIRAGEAIMFAALAAARTRR